MPQMSEERFDHIDATLQKLGARFDAVDQHLEAVDKRFDAVDRRLDVFDARFDAVDKRLDAFGARFDGVDKRFDGVDKRFDAVDKRFDRQEVLHEETRGKVDLALEHIVATNERLDRFEGRVKKRFNMLNRDVRRVLDNHEVRIHDLEQR
jgi:chromosome segregation ATPase